MSIATSGAERRSPLDRYRRRALIGGATCLALLVVLTVAVATGLTDPLDVAARNRFRPHLWWGPDQQRASHVVSWLSPSHVVVVLAVGAAGVSAWRLTVWPLVRSAAVVVATAGLTLAIKTVLDRGDPKGEHTSLGGSFPSGHSAVMLACVATGAMLVSCPTRWWQRLGVALLEGVLAVAMMYVALHWLSDIVGGALVAGVVLSGVALVAGDEGGRSHRNRWRRPAVARMPRGAQPYHAERHVHHGP